MAGRRIKGPPQARASFAVCCALAASATPALAQPKPRVAVMPLQSNNLNSPDTVRILDEFLLTELDRTGRFAVLGSSDLNALIGLGKMKDALGCDDVACAAELGGALGVTVLLAGSVNRLGSRLYVSLKLIDTRKQLVIARSRSRVDDSEQLYEHAIELAVTELLGLAPPAEPALHSLPAGTDPSPPSPRPHSAVDAAGQDSTTMSPTEVHRGFALRTYARTALRSGAAIIAREPGDLPPHLTSGSGCEVGSAQGCDPVDELQWSASSVSVETGVEIRVFPTLSIAFDVSYAVKDSFELGYAPGVDANNSSVDGAGGSLFAHRLSIDRSGIEAAHLRLQFAPWPAHVESTLVPFAICFDWQVPWLSTTRTPWTGGGSSVGGPGDGQHWFTLSLEGSPALGNVVSGWMQNMGPAYRLAYAVARPADSAINTLSNEGEFGSKPGSQLQALLGAWVRMGPIELSATASYQKVAEGRGYSAVADPLGRATWIAAHRQLEGTLMGQLRLDSDLVVTLTYSRGRTSSHFITGETPGVDENGDGQLLPDDDLLNPNFTSVDAHGARFALNEASFWAATMGLSYAFE